MVVSAYQIIIITTMYQIISVMYYTVLIVYEFVWVIIYEVICWHWYIRKTYQTSIYRFNAYHELNLWRVSVRAFVIWLDCTRYKVYIIARYFEFLYIYIAIIDNTVTNFWYISCWSTWCALTYNLYYHRKMRDLGPSHQLFEYSDEIPRNFYQILGLRLMVVCIVWTYSANTVFIESIDYILHRMFTVETIRRYWYELTFYSCIEMYLLNFLKSVYTTFLTIYINYDELAWLHKNYVYYENSLNSLKVLDWTISLNYKSIYLWFPWASFFTYTTIIGLLYLLTLLSIYNTDNTYYVVLYLIFLIFLVASTLVSLDLDIFAGLLLLIESVVILMLFFLIIYLNPNISNTNKMAKWKLHVCLLFVLSIVSVYSYPTIGLYIFSPFSLSANFYDEFYEALHESTNNDLLGIFINLYITDSILMVIIGLLLLIGSIICVVLVSFFIKLRNSSFKNFLNIFNIMKTCYSFIFLRKQNLSKQARSTSSSRIFEKKTFDTFTHTEYREKQDIFEKKKKETKSV